MFKRTFSTGPSSRVFYTSLAAALIGFGLSFDHAPFADVPAGGALAALHRDLARESASAEVEQVAQWSIASQDHAGLPFVVVDKVNARLFAFAADGRLLASAPVLLGASRSDGPAAGAATPAGRFVAATWLSVRDDGIVWISPDAALSLHGIPSGISPGHGMQRLASDEVEDKRISDGSLHVAGQFYRDYLGALKGQASVAYVLPEVLPVRDVFALYGKGSGQPPPSQVARKETVMTPESPGKSPNTGKAEHGTPSEVSWNDGAGRQPYANQGPEEAPEPGVGEVSEGDRGELSGRNLEQLEQVKKKP